MAKAFPIPGGTIEVTISGFDLRRRHYVTHDGKEATARATTPGPAGLGLRRDAPAFSDRTRRFKAPNHDRPGRLGLDVGLREASLQDRQLTEGPFYALSAMTGSIIPSVETTRLAKRIGGGYRQDPAEVAVLLNDAKAALLSDRAFARACVARALDLLHEDVARVSGPSTCPQRGLATWQVRRVVAYIEAHLESTIRVKDLAALTRLSASHFSRAFKQAFGQAPMTYVTRQRVEMAQRLLLTTEDSVCQISLACGMCDQAHLTRVFRRVVGQSPTAWRRVHAIGPSSSPAISSETR